MTKIIGLTGGIGSGKSKIAEYLMSKGIPVYIADLEAKKIMESEEVIREVRTQFGDDVIFEHKIDRRKLAAIVFNEPEKLTSLNNIVHPAVRQHFKAWIEQNKQHQLLVKEAAILFETGADADCDAVITVTAPLELRIDRVMQRDSVTYEEVLKRIDTQWSDEKKIQRSDFVITNIEFGDTKRQIDEILKKLQDM